MNYTKSAMRVWGQRLIGRDLLYIIYIHVSEGTVRNSRNNNNNNNNNDGDIKRASKTVNHYYVFMFVCILQ
jgi:hypothetical protein